VWSYDFVQDRTEDGRRIRMLTVIDEFTRRCLAIAVSRKLRSDDVLQCLTDLFVAHGPPEHIRSDNTPAAAFLHDPKETPLSQFPSLERHP
jgi:transposase InsO family protein